jgi:hypothetical protein
VPASVSKTCLVRFDNNKYSVATSAAERAAMFGDDPPVPADHDVVRIGTDLDRPADRRSYFANRSSHRAAKVLHRALVTKRRGDGIEA